MSNYKDRISKNIENINNSISDETQRDLVMNYIKDMVTDFTSVIISMNERQLELEEQLSNIYDILSNIESFLPEEEMLDPLYGEKCPYCDSFIPLYMIDDKLDDFECPNCHQVIEMEMMHDSHISKKNNESSDEGDIINF